LGSNPYNLAFRFLLEIAALVCIGIWGWNLSDGWIHYVLAPGLPVLIGAIWGIFAVPEDPSRSGKAPVPVSGIIRLILELTIFAIASWALLDMNHELMAASLGLLVLIHYLISYDRVLWLLKH
jgi:hypothetical protein